MMWGNYYGMSGWTWGFGAMVIVGVGILLSVLLVRSSANRRMALPVALPVESGSALSPKQILDQRYAKGELTTEEYRERLSALGLDT